MDPEERAVIDSGFLIRIYQARCTDRRSIFDRIFASRLRARVLSGAQMNPTSTHIQMFLAEPTAVAPVEPWRNRFVADSRRGCVPALPGRRAS